MRQAFTPACLIFILWGHRQAKTFFRCDGISRECLENLIPRLSFRFFWA